MGTHMRVLSKSYPLNTNITWSRSQDGFQIFLHPHGLDKNSLSIRRATLEIELLSL